MVDKNMNGVFMGLVGQRGRKIALVGAGIPVGAALALGGVAVADRIDGPGVTIVQETRTVPEQGILSTNVLCKEGQRVVSGGYGSPEVAHRLDAPLAVPVSAPGRVSLDPKAPEDSWDLVLLNPSDEKIDIKVYATCVPLD
ncbi:hypothetical protein [Streptosporangium carneum]|uniref:Uncharacterized protein n=1 Tax=Streptosporangium carneum TaxID=47481 RepID=A0A9W6I3X7_9ACTN|nr:hypothetical protein [Streptosporangium carneum]GLK11212.1 hypothetical protein GCM10017600_46180 [Streptosporangium carneum]